MSIGFSRQEYWSGSLCPPPPEDLPNPGTELLSLTSAALAGRFFTTSIPWEAPKLKVLVAQSCPTLCNLMVCPWNSPSKDTGVGCHSLLQGIFPTQVLNLSLLHCRWITYRLSYQGSLLQCCKKKKKTFILIIFSIRFFP